MMRINDFKDWLLFAISLGFAYVVLVSMISCKSTADVVVVKEVQRDTIFQDRLLFDSVYVSHNAMTDRTKDTVQIHTRDTLIRFRIIRDSIYISRIDTIPVIRTITKREEIPRPWHAIDYCAYASMIALALYAVYRYRKILK